MIGIEGVGINVFLCSFFFLGGGVVGKNPWCAATIEVRIWTSNIRNTKTTNICCWWKGFAQKNCP